MELREIGARLREERERRGLSLDDIAQQTKISLTSLQGIESGKSELLPHPVYVRGFIKVYAKFLELELGDALSELKLEKEDTPYRPVYKSASPERVSEQPEVRPLRSGNRLGVVVVALFVVLAGATYWFFATTSEPAKPVEQTAQEPVEEAAPAPAPAEEPAEAPVEPAPVAEMSAAPEAAPAVPVQAAAVQPAPAAASAQPAASTAQDAAQQSQAAPTQPAETNRVVIQARETCWVQATHENGTVREYMLQPGGSVRLNFSKVSLMLGNAGGVDIIVNGQPYATNAQPGQVRRLTLP